MTVDELRFRLAALDSATRPVALRKARISEDWSDENIINNFITTPHVEKQVCHGFGVPTEEERERQANSRRSWVGIVIASIALVVSIIGFVK